MMTSKGVITRRENMIEKYGSEEAYKQVMRERASKGGKKKTPLTKYRGGGAKYKESD